LGAFLNTLSSAASLVATVAGAGARAAVATAAESGRIERAPQQALHHVRSAADHPWFKELEARHQAAQGAAELMRSTVTKATEDLDVAAPTWIPLIGRGYKREVRELVFSTQEDARSKLATITLGREWTQQKNGALQLLRDATLERPRSGLGWAQEGVRQLSRLTTDLDQHAEVLARDKQNFVQAFNDANTWGQDVTSRPIAQLWISEVLGNITADRTAEQTGADTLKLEWLLRHDWNGEQVDYADGAAASIVDSIAKLGPVASSGRNKFQSDATRLRIVNSVASRKDAERRLLDTLLAVKDNGVISGTTYVEVKTLLHGLPDELSPRGSVAALLRTHLPADSSADSLNLNSLTDSSVDALIVSMLAQTGTRMVGGKIRSFLGTNPSRSQIDELPAHQWFPLKALVMDSLSPLARVEHLSEIAQRAEASAEKTEHPSLRALLTEISEIAWTNARRYDGFAGYPELADLGVLRVRMSLVGLMHELHTPQETKSADVVSW
jgi:hypothetical protein